MVKRVKAKKRTGKHPGGRPTVYRPEYVEQVRKLCEAGATDVELGDFFNVRRETIWAWGQKYPEFSNALKIGRESADERVVSSFYHRAIGYTFDAEKIAIDTKTGKIVRAKYREHVPPDTAAASFWLKNRRPKEWRDRQDHSHSGTLTLESLVQQSFGEEKPKEEEKS